MKQSLMTLEQFLILIIFKILRSHFGLIHLKKFSHTLDLLVFLQDEEYLLCAEAPIILSFMRASFYFDIPHIFSYQFLNKFLFS